MKIAACINRVQGGYSGMKLKCEGIKPEKSHSSKFGSKQCDSCREGSTDSGQTDGQKERAHSATLFAYWQKTHNKQEEKH